MAFKLQMKSSRTSNTSKLSVFNSSNHSLPTGSMGSPAAGMVNSSTTSFLGSVSPGFGAPLPNSVQEADVLMTKLAMAHNRDTQTKIYRTIRDKMNESPTNFFPSFVSCVLSKEAGWLSITSQMVESEVIPPEAVDIFIRLAESKDPVVCRLALQSGIANLLVKSKGTNLQRLCQAIHKCLKVPNGYEIFGKKKGCELMAQSLELVMTREQEDQQQRPAAPKGSMSTAGNGSTTYILNVAQSTTAAATSTPADDLAAILNLIQEVLDQEGADGVASKQLLITLRVPISIIKKSISFLESIEANVSSLRLLLKLTTSFSTSLANTNWFVESVLSLGAHCFSALPQECIVMCQELLCRVSAFEMVATHKQIFPNAVATMQRCAAYAIDLKRKKAAADQQQLHDKPQVTPTDGNSIGGGSQGMRSGYSEGIDAYSARSPAAISLEGGGVLGSPKQQPQDMVSQQQQQQQRKEEEEQQSTTHTPMSLLTVILRFCVFSLDKLPDDSRASLPLHAYVASGLGLKGEAISQDVAKLYVHLLVQCIRYCGLPVTEPYINYAHMQRCKDSLGKTGFDFATFTPILMVIHALSSSARPCLGLIRFWMPFSELVRTNMVSVAQMQSVTGQVYDQEKQSLDDQNLQMKLQAWMQQANTIDEGAQAENRSDLQTLENISRAAIGQRMRVEHGTIAESGSEQQFKRRDLKAVHGLQRMSTRAERRSIVFRDNMLNERDVVSALKLQCKEEKDLLTAETEMTIANTGLMDDDVSELRAQLKLRKSDVSKRFAKKEGGELKKLGWVVKQGSSAHASIATYYQRSNISTPGVIVRFNEDRSSPESGSPERPGILGRADHDGELGVFGRTGGAVPIGFGALGPFPHRELLLLQLKEEILRGIGFYSAGGPTKFGGTVLGADNNTPLGGDQRITNNPDSRDGTRDDEEVSIGEAEAVEWAGLQRRFKNLPETAFFEATRNQRQQLQTEELLARRVSEEAHLRTFIIWIWEDFKRNTLILRCLEEAVVAVAKAARAPFNMSVTVRLPSPTIAATATSLVSTTDAGGGAGGRGESKKVPDGEEENPLQSEQLLKNLLGLEEANRQRVEWKLLLRFSTLHELGKQEEREAMTRQLVRGFSEREFRTLVCTVESEERTRLRYLSQLSLCVLEVEYFEGQDRHALQCDLLNRLGYFSNLATLLAGRPGIAFVFDLA